MMNDFHSGLLELLKSQIDKLDLLINNYTSLKNFKIYQKKTLESLFKNKSENLPDFTLELYKDYEEILKLKDEELKKYKIQKLGEKTEALFKYIKIVKISFNKRQKTQLAKENTKSNNLKSNNSKNSKDKLYKQSLVYRRTWLQGMIKKINLAISKKNSELNNKDSTLDKIDSETIKKDILKLNVKKQEIEKELFSITEQL